MVEATSVTKRPRVRQRTISPSLTIDHYEYHTWWDNRPPTKYLVRSGVVPASFNIMRDVVTTPYWSVIASGGIVNEPMTKSEFIYSAAPCDLVDVYYTRPYAAYSDTVTHSGHHWPSQKPDAFPVIALPSGFESARDKAIARAFAKAGGPGFSTLINLYQLPQLVRMIRDNHRRLRSLWKVIKSDSRTRRVRALGYAKKVKPSDLSGLWLEWRFGWRPLLMDIQDLIKALEDSSKKPPERITYRATERFDFTTSKENTSEYNPIGAPSGVKNHFQTHVETHAEYRAGIMLDGSKITNLQRFGVRTKDIPSAVWDAVPYSFVVDWFLGVSTWLSSFSVERGSILASWCTDRVEQVTRRVAKFDGGHLASGSGYGAQAYTRSSGTATLTEKFSCVSRAVGVTPPVLPVLDPRWAQPTNLSHLLDAIALLIQQLARLKR